MRLHVGPEAELVTLSRRHLLHTALPWLFLVFVSVACSTAAEPTRTQSPLPAATPIAPTVAPAAQAQTGDAVVALATTDLGVGPNRLAFGIIGSDLQPIRAPEAELVLVYLDADPAVPASAGTARFVQWPTGGSGVYVAEVSFDRAGRWGVIANVTGEDGKTIPAQAGFIVAEQTSAPTLGQPAPSSLNKTGADVSDLKEITSSPVPDPELYEMTISEAVDSGRPTVVAFATPAFCQTATCGPQVEMVSAVKERFKDQSNFIHVEVYENPHLIEGDLSNASISPLIEEWGLVAEPFTFVLDDQGRVFAKFQGFVTDEELSDAVSAVVGE